MKTDNQPKKPSYVMPLLSELDNQPKHTQGELKINKYGSIVDKNGDTILVAGVGFPMGKNEEAEANAQRIVKAVNMQDNVISEMNNIKFYANQALESLGEGSLSEVMGMLEGILEKAERLLKQADSK